MTSNQLRYQSNLETNRHNLVTEAQTWVGLNETHRHNVETERLGWANLSENRRHNRATESLGWANLQESRRHNYAVEFESQRHNRAQESLSLRSLNNDLMKIHETERHNRVQEQLTDRWNRATNSEYYLGEVTGEHGWLWGITKGISGFKDVYHNVAQINNDAWSRLSFSSLLGD